MHLPFFLQVTITVLKIFQNKITEDAILNFIPTRVSGTGFSASLNLSFGSGFRIPAFPDAR